VGDKKGRNQYNESQAKSEVVWIDFKGLFLFSCGIACTFLLSAGGVP